MRFVQLTLTLWTLFFIKVAFAQPVDSRCALPDDLHTVVTTKYPEAKLVTLSALSTDDKKFYLQDHGQGCPGLIKVDFFGDQRPTFAFVLVLNNEGAEKATLLVAHRVEGVWRITLLDTVREAGVPVVWSQSPGKYTDVYGEKEIVTSMPVIVFSRYESWSVLYAWKGKRVVKIWLQD